MFAINYLLQCRKNKTQNRKTVYSALYVALELRGRFDHFTWDVENPRNEFKFLATGNLAKNETKDLSVAMLKFHLEYPNVLYSQGSTE